MRIFYFFYHFFICLLNGLGSSGGFLIAYKGVQFVMMMAFLDFRIFGFWILDFFFFLSSPLPFLLPPLPLFLFSLFLFLFFTIFYFYFF